MALDTRPSPAPPPQAVLLKHAEVMASALASKARLSGGTWWFGLTLFLLFVFAIWIGHLAAFMLVQQLPFAMMFAIGPWLPTLIPPMLCLVATKLALALEYRRSTRAYLAALGRVGAPLERAGSYEVTPEALVLTTERMALAPRWQAIDTVERGVHGWVISAEQLHFLIPFADFAVPGTERALVAAITSRLTAEARARSREAVEFSEAEPSFGESVPPVALPPEPAAPRDEDADQPRIEARGWLTQEQASWAANVMYGQIARPGFHRWAYPLTGAVTGFTWAMLAVGLLTMILPSILFLRFPAATFFGVVGLLLVGAAFGLAQGYARLGIVLGKAWSAGLEKRGVPEQIEANWRLTPTGIAYDTARFSGEAAYSSIHQLLHEHGYWIIGADGLTLTIPDTAFATPGEATSFMTSLLDKMTAPARARSTAVDVSAATAS